MMQALTRKAPGASEPDQVGADGKREDGSSRPGSVGVTRTSSEFAAHGAGVGR